MQISAAIRSQVNANLIACIKLAEARYGREFKMPKVTYRLRGRTAGTACLHDWEIQLNAVLLTENTEEFMSRTVPHELAHLIDFKMHPENYNRRKNVYHGRTWRMICYTIGMTDIKTTHSYDTTNSRVHKRTQAKHVYTCCGCQKEMLLGAKRHANVTVGRAKYWIRGCQHHGGFSYQGVEGSTAPALPKAAQAPRIPKPTGRVTKKAHCEALYDSSLGRQANLDRFVQQAGCTVAGASTYYNTIRRATA